ncbi:scarecrow-like protein 1 [Salvia miltiorrhiza]|uniref:scarecrow-like protein 1 n=1 Tax=Salvia miltiorrhiza TaxID=226208 RepID=UPI0025AC35A2|nr:scarecrow-like protein 1 [Salvia miltiorrhiza]XP_057785892.1 scarecrow-like protein 1 [Salvia miltiorrhiza]XP_057785893.1 scarecrow-like protein 1 [Salvia miltiorrhiza]XP_057785894.1 scarecrow-like protein 1 [Salvia miltiorrhiza]XP_057785895.1 scarecrow-like protein 1 [Salvia miltiorrhiza]
MSLVGSAALFRSPEPYSLKDDNDSSGLSTSGFYSYSSDSYDPKYFLDSPSSSDVLGHQIQSSSSQHSSGENPFQSSLGFDYASELDSPRNIDYDEDKLNLKLQELEKALLDDNAATMEIDGNFLDSPKESSSSDSNLSSTTSGKEMVISGPLSRKHMLFECAAVVHNGDFKRASSMISVLRQHVSIQGDPSERIAAYMVEALVARIAASGRGLYRALKCKEAPSSDRLSAMQVLFEVCPCFRFGFMAANGAILEAFRDEKRVHIVDFDVNQGSQYYTLLQTLANTSGDRPHVRLTGVDDPESVQRPVGGLKIIGQRLELLAKQLHLSFEFKAVPAETALVSPSVLDCRPGEALVVNFAFQLHHLPDESVSTVNLRDQLLRMIKGLKPKLVTVVEQDMNTNTSPFPQRFAEAYNYYSAVFESLDATLARESQDRMNVEKHCLARDIINVVACEGEERIERYEVAGKWRSRMTMAGFTACGISWNVRSEIEKLIQQYSERYKVKEEKGALHFGWEEKTLIVSSAWR